MNVRINGEELRHGAAREGLPGETFEVRPAAGSALAPDALTVVSAPEGVTPKIDGRMLSGFDRPGLYRFRLAYADETSRWVDIFIFEPSVLGLVPAMQSSGSSTPRSNAERRLVLRSLAQHGRERGDGTFKGITSQGINLSQFGA